MFSLKRFTALLIGCVLWTVPGGTVLGQSIRTWNAPGGGNWNNDGHWDSAQPASNDSVVFGSTGDGHPNFMDLPGLALESFTVTNATHGTDLNNGALTVNTLRAFGVGSGSTGRLDISSGTLHVGSTLQTSSGQAAGGIIDPASAMVVFGNDGILKIGAAGDRARLLMGDTANHMQWSFLTCGALLGDWFLDRMDLGRNSSVWVVDMRGAFAKVDLSSVTNPVTIDVSERLLLGADGRATVGHVLLSDRVDLRVGSASDRADVLRVGAAFGGATVHVPSGLSSQSRLILGGGRFDVFVTNLYVAHGLAGLVDATNSAGGILDVSKDLIVSSGGSAGSILLGDGIDVRIGSPTGDRGDFILAQGSGVLSSDFKMGNGQFEAYVRDFSVLGIKSTGPYSDYHALFDAGTVSHGILNVNREFVVGTGRNNTGSATVKLIPNFDITLGTPAEPIPMIVGWQQGGVCTVTAGGTFNADLVSLWVGTNTAAGVGVTALLDLAAVTNGSINVAGNVVIGAGHTGVGEVRLPGIGVTAEHLYVGSTNTGSRGTLSMTGTVFSVSGDVVLNGSTAANKARILTTLTGESGGLDLGPFGLLTVNQGLIHIDFTVPANDPEEVHWGLRWAGAHVPELQALADAGKLTWDAGPIAPADVSIFIRDGYTYVGTFNRAVVEAWPATEITDVSATLNGRMGRLEDWDVTDDVDVYFCWGAGDGLTVSTGNWQHVVWAASSPNKGDFFDVFLTDLAYGVPIFYRVYATNHSTLDETWSHLESFTPVVHPTVEVYAATNIGRSRATLRGAVPDDGGQTPEVWFAWWKSGSSSTSTVSLGLGVVPFDYVVENLDGASTYFFHAVASNVAGVSTSTSSSFNTLPLALVDYVWIGNTSTDWHTDTNWDPVGIPGAGDGVRIVGPGKSVVLGDPTPVLGAVGITNAALTLTNLNTRLKADDLNISGGTLRLHEIFPSTTELADRVALTADQQSMHLTEYLAILGDHTIDLAGGTVTAGTFRIWGLGLTSTARVAVINSAVGDATLEIPTLLELAGDNLDVQPQGSGNKADAYLETDPNVTLKIGSESVRATAMKLSDSGLLWSSGFRSSALVVRGRIEAWVNTIMMSAGLRSFSNATFDSLLDFSEATGFVDVASSLFSQRYGPVDIRFGDGIDFRMGSPSVRGGNLTIPTPGISFGSGAMHLYVTNFSSGRGHYNFLATNVSEGVLDVAGNVDLSGGSGAFGGANTTVLLGDAVQVKLGDPSAPVNFTMGFGTYTFTNTFRVGTNRFEAYINTATVARASNSEGSYLLTLLDLSRPLNGILSISNALDIAVSGQRNCQSYITIGEGFHTTIGSESYRARLALADGVQWRTNILDAAGTFEAYLSGMVVGRRTTSTAASGLALLDLSAATNGTLDVVNDIIIGVGRDAVATVRLPAFAAFTDNLYIGSADTGARGTLSLEGTVLRVSGDIVLDGLLEADKARIMISVNGLSSGLDMAESASLDVKKGLIHIDFTEPLPDRTRIYWGLRWKGDHLDTLLALQAAGQLTWNDSRFARAARVCRSGAYTYVGVPPPEGLLLRMR